MIRGILNYGSIALLSLLVEQPVADLIADRRLLYVRNQFTVCLKRLLKPVRLRLCLFHGSFNLGLGRLIGLFRPVLRAAFLFTLFHRVRQLRRLRGQFRLYRLAVIVHGIIIYLILIIVTLNLFHGGRKPVRNRLAVSTEVKTLLKIRLYPAFGSIRPIEFLHIIPHRSPGRGSRLLQYLLKIRIIRGGIIGKAFRLRFLIQPLVAGDGLHGQFVKIISPGHCIRIHLGIHIPARIQSEVAQISTVLVEITAACHIIIEIKLNPGYLLPVYSRICPVHGEIIPDRKRSDDTHQRSHHQNPRDPADFLFSGSLFLLFLPPLHLQVIFGNYLFRFLPGILLPGIPCFLIRHDINFSLPLFSLSCKASSFYSILREMGSYFTYFSSFSTIFLMQPSSKGLISPTSFTILVKKSDAESLHSFR